MAKEKKVKDVEPVTEETKKSKKTTVEKEVKEKKVKEKKEKKQSALKTELKKVVWPKAKDVFKYTFAVMIFCIFLALFFECMELIMAFVKGLFN